MAGNDYDPIPRAITRAIHAARLGGGTDDSYDDVPRTLWGMTTMQIVTAFLAGWFSYDILRGLLLFVAWAGGPL